MVLTVNLGPFLTKTNRSIQRRPFGMLGTDRLTILSLCPICFSCYFHGLIPDGTETFGELNLGEQYFEGDIILTEKQRQVVQTLWQDDKVENSDLMKGFRELWPSNTVPYTIAKGLRKYKVSTLVPSDGYSNKYQWSPPESGGGVAILLVPLC